MISPKEALVTTLLYLSVLPLLSGLVCGASASVFSAGSRRQDVADSFEAIVRPRNLAASADALSLSQTTNFPRDLAPAGAELCKVGQPCADGSCCGPKNICGYGPDYCGTGCSSGCTATAMCGQYSKGGTLKCGMNLCCSAYGWCGTDAGHCTIAPKGAPDPGCQVGFGLCKIVPPPSCGTSSGTSHGRTIGYYQGANVNQRACNRITPSQINTTGLTHLYYAFARIDPGTFFIVPTSDGDAALYNQFTALKTSKLQTWIAIGGFDFSNVGPTHTTWSDLASTQANRAAFIRSAISFMQYYQFQGLDIDWEYPVAPERGGRPEDLVNFVSLVKEMRAAFGTKYGISLTLAPDYWYLRGFDAKGMEPYVDWFGFMAYDLHGSWDADVKTLGSIVRGQADIREIRNDTDPLWFDALNPAKINLGVAYYGRGYTLSDPKCNYIGCKFSGPSKAAPCTAQTGVMSLIEIQQLIATHQPKIYPDLLKDPMMKQITWDDQWIGYDDDETIALKKTFANDLCFGGTMIWSVDFNSGAGSGNNPDWTNQTSPTDQKAIVACQGNYLDFSPTNHNALNVSDWFANYQASKQTAGVTLAAAFASDFPNAVGNSYSCSQFLDAKNKLTKVDGYKAFLAYVNPLMSGFALYA